MNDLSLLDPYFRTKISKLLEIFRKNRIDFIITSTFRTQEEQDNLTAQGYPTAAKESRHLTGQAIDLSIEDNYQRSKAMSIAKGFGFFSVDYPGHPKSKYAIHIDDRFKTAIREKKNDTSWIPIVIIGGLILYGLYKTFEQSNSFGSERLG